MYKNYKLSHFFLLVAGFLVIVIGLIAYGWRRNAPSNKWDNNGDVYGSAFKEEGTDISTPFYETKESASHSENAKEEESGSTEHPATNPDHDGVDLPSKGTVDSAVTPAPQSQQQSEGQSSNH